MKSESINWKLPVFIGALVIAALLINYFFFTKEAAKREAKAQAQREAAAAVVTNQAAEKLAKEKKEAEEAKQKATKETEEKRLQAAKDFKEKSIRETREAKNKADAARKKAIEEAAAEHARFLTRYLNSGFIRKPGVATIAVAIESEQGTVNQNIATALTKRFKADDTQLLNSFFKPEFVADRYVASIFSGDTGILVGWNLPIR